MKLEEIARRLARELNVTLLRSARTQVDACVVPAPLSRAG